MVGALSARFDAARYQSLTGMNFDGYSALSKLVWMQEHSRELFDAGVAASTPQAYLLRMLGAEINVVDPSVAAHFGLLDLRTRNWSDDLREAFGVASLRLPRIVDSGSVVGTSSPKAKRELGIPEGVPLVLAASDGICAELGVGVTRPGQIYAYLGTASAIAGPILATAARPAGAVHSGGIIRMPGRDAAHDRLLGLGGTGGSAVEWAMKLLRLRHVERFDMLAAGCAPGASGVLFVPALAGAAAPEPEPTARGAIVGLSLASRPEHVARAIFEGVALELRCMLDEIRCLGIKPTEVRLTGGGGRSPTWTRVIANVLQLPTLRSPHAEASLRGAASYAFAVANAQPAGTVAEQWSALQDRTEPSLPLAEVYGRLAGHYRLLRTSFVRSGIDRALFDTAAWLSITAAT
jgi:xylulokinase